MDEACYIRGVSDATWIEKIAWIDEEESIDELETGLDRARGTSFSSPELHFRSKSKPVSGPRIESGRTGDYNVSKVVSHVMVVYFHCGERTCAVRVTTRYRDEVEKFQQTCEWIAFAWL